MKFLEFLQWSLIGIVVAVGSTAMVYVLWLTSMVIMSVCHALRIPVRVVSQLRNRRKRQ